MEPIKLTQYSKSSGCGCKIAPAVLQDILQQASIQQVADPRLLIGYETSDDACVYDLGDGTAIISTTDFFTPIVDDAYIYGQIAAANALSDVYAMGGRPIYATAILGWPINTISTDVAASVMKGAAAICQEAQIPIAGGHSIETSEPIFGLSVNGIVDIQHIKANNTARDGDLLFLTKPIGSGILSAAMKRDKILPTDIDPWIQSITTLNKVGAQLGRLDGVHAMTDITGFGLLGHLLEMCAGSGVHAVIDYHAIPQHERIGHYIAQFIVPDATYRNWNAYKDKIHIDSNLPMQEAFSLLPDPQTNGGLLIAVAPHSADAVIDLLRQHHIQSIAPIGSLISGGDGESIIKFQ